VLRPRIATPLPQVTTEEIPPAVVKAALEPLPVVADRPMPPMPAVAPVAADVKLADNIAVAPELAHAGAQSYSPEEAAVLFRPKWSKALIAAIACSVVLLGGLTWMAVTLAQADAPPAAVPVQRPLAVRPVVKAEPVAAPVAPAVDPVTQADDDALMPLTPVAARERAARKPKPAPKSVARPDVAKDPQPEQFEFLEDKAAAPAEELKRPTF
jgi:hypothetical protein